MPGPEQVMHSLRMLKAKIEWLDSHPDTSRQGARPGVEKVGTVGTAGAGNFPF